MVQKKMRNMELERRKRGKSQMDLQIETGIDASYICKAERYGVMYDGHLEKVAKALDWSGDPKELLREVN